MAETGTIVPPIPTWPTRPVAKVRRRKPGQETPAQDEQNHDHPSPADDQEPHVDEYA